jgi:aspartyl-tRNA(Asn)/glutamyl-tRNA(Gln) amidotransferase subunit A
MTEPSPSSQTPLSGRGIPFRFEALADLGPLPEQGPVPPETVSSVLPPSKAEGDLAFLTIAEASIRIREGELSPVALTRALLTRIERVNPLLNAFITVTADLALDQAKEAEVAIQRGRYLGPLHGIPVTLKDLVATAGILTTGGTGALADWVPKEDAFVWRRLREAGAILLGKMNLHEMAAGSTNLNPFYGASRNPWNPERITGGSSGGSGAGVAGHLCFASIGSDTGGSIRMPASLCGTVGLKPTFGLVSTRGALYLAWTNDHLGPLTKTVEDAALILNAIAGHDPLNPISAPVSAEDYTAHLNEGLEGLRIAVPTNYFWELELTVEDQGTEVRVGPDPQVVKAVQAGIQVLKDQGATVVEISIEGLEELLRRPLTDFTVERAFYLEELPEERKERFSQRYHDGLIRGLATTGAEYLRTLQRGQQVQVALESALEPYDAFVVPTTPIVAPPIKAAEAANARAEAEAAARREAGESAPLVRERGPTSTIGRYTGPFNRSGQPALTVPCGFTTDGLPIGMMIVGKRFAESTVLRIGHAYQQATNWHNRRPPLLDGRIV